jgi:hypothetical protein
MGLLSPRAQGLREHHSTLKLFNAGVNLVLGEIVALERSPV